MGGAWSQEAGVLVQVIGRVDFRRTRRVRDNAPHLGPIADGIIGEGFRFAGAIFDAGELARGVIAVALGLVILAGLCGAATG